MKYKLFLSLSLSLSAVCLSRPLHPSDRTSLPEGEGPARHARLLRNAECQPAAEHGCWIKDVPERPPDADLQVSSCLCSGFFLKSALCSVKKCEQRISDNIYIDKQHIFGHCFSLIVLRCSVVVAVCLYLIYHP